MKRSKHSILLVTFFVLAMYVLANENVQIKNDTYFNAEAKTASQDSLITLNQSLENKKIYWGLGTSVLGYDDRVFGFVFGSIFLTTFDGFIGYNITKKIAFENQLSYYQGLVSVDFHYAYLGYLAWGRYLSNNLRIKTNIFSTIPLYVSIGYKSEFNFFYYRFAYEDFGGKTIEPSIINKKPKYWNSLYSFSVDYTIAKRKEYSIDVSLPVYFSNSTLNLLFNSNLPVPKQLYHDRYATGMLNYGIGLRIKF